MRILFWLCCSPSAQTDPCPLMLHVEMSIHAFWQGAGTCWEKISSIPLLLPQGLCHRSAPFWCRGFYSSEAFYPSISEGIGLFLSSARYPHLPLDTRSELSSLELMSLMHQDQRCWFVERTSHHPWRSWLCTWSSCWTPVIFRCMAGAAIQSKGCGISSGYRCLYKWGMLNTISLSSHVSRGSELSVVLFFRAFHPS